MSNPEKQSTQIQDIAVAEKAAYSAKDLRSVAAAKRIIDAILADNYDPTGESSANRLSIAQQLLAQYAIYPEVFEMLFTPKKTSDAERLLATINKIITAKQLSTYNITGDNHTGAPECFDAQAAIIENVTAALTLTPPSQDFLKDTGLGAVRFNTGPDKGYERTVCVDDVVKLPGEIKNLAAHIANVIRDSEALIEQYNDEYCGPGYTKFDIVIKMLNRACTDYFSTGNEFEEKLYAGSVNAAMNDGGTKIDDFFELCRQGASQAIAANRARMVKLQTIYDAILSGEAATYKSATDSD